MGIFQSIVVFLRAFIIDRAAMAIENLALRQQVAVYRQSVKRPKLRPRDRIFWVLLSRLWSNWQSAPAIVQPKTIVCGKTTSRATGSPGRYCVHPPATLP
jgi:putative transposase